MTDDFPKLKRIEIVLRKVNFPALDELKKKLDEQDELKEKTNVLHKG